MEQPHSRIFPAHGTQPDIAHLMQQRRQVLATALAQWHTEIPAILVIAQHMIQALETGHKILVAGNGGSAAEAQHFAAELVGRFKHERTPYPALALTADSAILSAISNDYGYQQVFARQVQAYGQTGDLFIAFSTSGESENLIQAAIQGKAYHLTVIAITGGRASRLERVADCTVRAPVVDTAITQELHMMMTHMLCEVVETYLLEKNRQTFSLSQPIKASNNANHHADEVHEERQHAQRDFS